MYARVEGGEPEAHTVEISAPECADSECEANEAHTSEARFDGASRDGSRAFFLDTQQLTDTAVQGKGSAGHQNCSTGAQCNLYESECFTQCETEHEQRRLLDLTAGSSEPEAQGVLASSGDGSHAYFIAKGVLTGEERPGCRAQFEAEHVAEEGECHATRGRENLYVYAEGHTAFVAKLPSSDASAWLEAQNGNVTPDGRFLVFTSSGWLTPDDHAESSQVFRYDADTGALIRLSAGDDGFNDDGNTGAGHALIVPGATDAGGVSPVRGDPTMSDDGSYVFFESPVALTAHAVKTDTIVGRIENHIIYAENIYEWHEGHVYLISDGHDVSGGGGAGGPCANYASGAIEPVSSSSCLLGTDPSGHDVFFTTADQLVPKDTDTQLDIYDARVCEPENGNPCIQEPPPAPAPCDGENCHGIPEATPSLIAPGSASFNGVGNVSPTSTSMPPAKPKALTRAQKLAAATLKACHQKKGKKRARCERRARKNYGPPKAKKSSRGRK